MNVISHNERFNDGPNAYAYRLAGYNRDAAYIQSMTRREHGVELPQDLIAAYIEKQEKAKLKAKRIVENREAKKYNSYSEGVIYDPRLSSFKRAQKDAERKRRFEKQAKEINETPFKAIEYKRWQGGSVRVKVDEIRANAKAEKPSGPGASLLIHAVAQAFYIAPDQLLGDGRNKVLVAARAVVAKILRERNPAVWSYPKIARAIGRSDHSTVINLIDTWEQRCRQIPAMREVYKMMGGKDAS